MPKVVHARPRTIASASQADLAGQAPENTVNALHHQSTTSRCYKEMWAAAQSEMAVAPLSIAAERCARRRMQR